MEAWSAPLAGRFLASSRALPLTPAAGTVSETVQGQRHVAARGLGMVAVSVSSITADASAGLLPSELQVWCSRPARPGLWAAGDFILATAADSGRFQIARVAHLPQGDRSDGGGAIISSLLAVALNVHRGSTLQLLPLLPAGCRPPARAVARPSKVRASRWDERPAGPVASMVTLSGPFELPPDALSAVSNGSATVATVAAAAAHSRPLRDVQLWGFFGRLLHAKAVTLGQVICIDWFGRPQLLVVVEMSGAAGPTDAQGPTEDAGLCAPRQFHTNLPAPPPTPIPSFTSSPGFNHGVDHSLDRWGYVVRGKSSVRFATATGNWPADIPAAAAAAAAATYASPGRPPIPGTAEWIAAVAKTVAAASRAVKSTVIRLHSLLTSPLGAPRPGPCMLICGGPGSGKTHLIEAVIAGAGPGLSLVRLDGGALLRASVDATVDGIAAAFETARRCAPAVLVIEHLDAVNTSREYVRKTAQTTGAGLISTPPSRAYCYCHRCRCLCNRRLNWTAA